MAETALNFLFLFVVWHFMLCLPKGRKLWQTGNWVNIPIPTFVVQKKIKN